MRDLYNHLEIETVMAPIAVTADTSDEDIDLAGFDSCVILGVTGAGTITSTHKMNFRISHADDDGTGSSDSYSYVEDEDLLGAGDVTDGVPASPVMIAEDSEYALGYVGGKRFLKIELIEADTTDAIIGLYVIKGHPLDVPPIE